MRGFQKVSSHIFFLANYWSKKIEKNTGRFVMKFYIFPHNSRTNPNISYIVYLPSVNQRDRLSVQILEVLHNHCFDFLGCVKSLACEIATHHRLTHMTLFAINCRYLTVNFRSRLTVLTQKPNNTPHFTIRHTC